MALDERGAEVLDTTPVALPVGFHKPPSIQEMIRMYVRQHVSQQAQSQGAESFEEADDFDVDEDDPLPRTQYELDGDTQNLPAWREDEQRRAAVEAAEARFASSVAGVDQAAKPVGPSAGPSGSGQVSDGSPASGSGVAQ